MDRAIKRALNKGLILDGMGQLPQDFDKSDRNERLLINGMDKAAVEEALKSYTCTGALIQCGMGQFPQEELTDEEVASWIRHRATPPTGADITFSEAMSFSIAYAALR